MREKIGELIKRKSKNLSEFARLIDVPYGTIYDIATEKTKVDNIGIGVFIKIAEGLGMTAEELYYGTPPREPAFADARQTALNGYYSSLNEESKTDLMKFAKSYAADTERRMVKDKPETMGDEPNVGNVMEAARKAG